MNTLALILIWHKNQTFVNLKNTIQLKWIYNRTFHQFVLVLLQNNGEGNLIIHIYMKRSTNAMGIKIAQLSLSRGLFYAVTTLESCYYDFLIWFMIYIYTWFVVGFQLFAFCLMYIFNHAHFYCVNKAFSDQRSMASGLKMRQLSHTIKM